MPELNSFEVIGFLTGLLGVWLAARQNIWTWPVGLVYGISQAIFFYQLKLYADAGLQLVYFGASIYGWYEWLYGGKNKTELPVSRLSTKGLSAVVLTGAILTILLGLYFRKFTDASFPILDSALAAYSLIGQFLLTRKKIENWILWFLVDIVYVWLYVQKEAYLTAILYFVFLGLAVQGFLKWRQELKPRTA